MKFIAKGKHLINIIESSKSQMKKSKENNTWMLMEKKNIKKKAMQSINA